MSLLVAVHIFCYIHAHMESMYCFVLQPDMTHSIKKFFLLTSNKNQYLSKLIAAATRRGSSANIRLFKPGWQKTEAFREARAGSSDHFSESDDDVLDSLRPRDGANKQ
jgi:hypothetical protein